MLPNLTGIDHALLAVADLAGAASRWEALGFTVSPRGVHSEAMGTANHTVMLEDAYVELLGVLAPSAFNAPTRARLAEGGGLDRIVFRLGDAAAAREELRGQGVEASAPISFSRPVARPGGAPLEARFDILTWTVAEPAAGLGFFACRHHTPEAVWLPELLDHANGARRLLRIELRVAEPAREAARFAAMAALPVTAGEGGAAIVADPRRGPALALLAGAEFDAAWKPRDAAARSGLVFGLPDPAAARPFAAWEAEDGRLAAVAEGVLVGWQAG